MPQERIAVQLSPFEKIQVLRDEKEARQEELTKLESTIRDKLREIEVHRYLESLSPYYTMTVKELPTTEEIDELENRRTLLAELITSIEREMPALLEATDKGGTAPATPPPPAADAPAPSREGAPRKAKFDF
ncbi:MAG: hypothetical protein ACOCX4_04835 [Planctomycetota bacterium]